MAAAGLGDHLTCSICLSIYTDPVSLPCGHNFCQGCIGRSWDSQEGSGAYSCPECRAGHPERPALQRNRTLGNIAEQFLSTHPEHDGTETSGNRRCSAHKKILEYYCPKDGTCVCVSCCLAGEHRGHKVELLSEASQRQRQTLRKDLRNLNLGREVNERGAQRLQERIKEVESKAAGETERVAAYFRDIRERMEAFEAQLTSDISGQKERLLQPFTSQISQLERETDELSKRIHDIEELSYIRDPLTFLQALKSAGVVGTESGGTGRGEIPIPNVGDMDVARISDTLVPGLAGIVQQVTHRRLYGQNAAHMFLDPGRAGPNIRVSGDRKLAYHEDHIQRPYIPERYQDAQVLSSAVFNSGHHYWDVDASEFGDVRLGVVYTSGGTHPFIGDDYKSWCLFRCFNNTAFLVKHSNMHLTLPHVPSSCRRFRVSLDYKAGQLSFYELSEPIRRLHTYTAKFTEPLRAAFWVWRYESNDAWLRILS